MKWREEKGVCGVDLSSKALNVSEKFFEISRILATQAPLAGIS